MNEMLTWRYNWIRSAEIFLPLVVAAVDAVLLLVLIVLVAEALAVVVVSVVLHSSSLLLFLSLPVTLLLVLVVIEIINVVKIILNLKNVFINSILTVADPIKQFSSLTMNFSIFCC